MCKVFNIPLGIWEHLKATVHDTLAHGQDKLSHAKRALTAQEHSKHCRGHMHPSALMDLRHSYLHHKNLSHKLSSQSNCTKSFSSSESPSYQPDDFLSL